MDINNVYCLGVNFSVLTLNEPLFKSLYCAKTEGDLNDG